MEAKTQRRDFLKKTVAAAAFMALGGRLKAAETQRKKPKEVDIPLYRGFNLLNMFVHTWASDFEEKDFETIREFGFNFARIPLSYWCWSSEENWFKIDEKALERIDKCVELGGKYGLHVNLNFHRAPGYCINRWEGKELPKNLFLDLEPLEACAFHWRHFAQSYKGIDNARLSFNLVNEPPKVPTQNYIRVVRVLTEAIRSEDPSRLIFIDGENFGERALRGVEDIDGIVQSAHGYYPNEISQYQASWLKKWINFDKYPADKLSWPFKKGDRIIDKQVLSERYDKGWAEYAKDGGKIHAGEFGAYCKLPHKIALAYLSDQLSIYKERGWGWALWNLKGTFGVFDSKRKDVVYENYKGMKLDREMMELLLRS